MKIDKEDIERLESARVEITAVYAKLPREVQNRLNLEADVKLYMEIMKLKREN